uniref:Uncharacterized protein n=1 Tax=Daphnia galeata TaxID=27404 RepID=A0A8J2RFD6_9CRUS|nr:unnamed protein product [Daphnia galeata]
MKELCRLNSHVITLIVSVLEQLKDHLTIGELTAEICNSAMLRIVSGEWAMICSRALTVMQKVVLECMGPLNLKLLLFLRDCLLMLFKTTRQVGNGPSPTQFFQQIEECSQSNCVDSLVTVPSMPVNTQLTVERAHANAVERTEAPSLLNINSTSSTLNRQLTLHHDQFFAQATNTEGFEKAVKKLVRETLKQNDILTNIMDKLVLMDGKLNNVSLPAVLQEAAAANPTSIMLPLQEVEDIKLLEQELLDKENYYALVRKIRLIGGSSVYDSLKRAWESVFQ